MTERDQELHLDVVEHIALKAGGMRMIRTHFR